MRKYEIMYILNSSLEEAVRQETMAQLHAIITDGKGTIDNVDEEHWGLRDFAYKIDNMSKGYYVVVTFHADNDVITELDRICRINQNVVRHMIVNLDE
jgi:small subunit ribosomal protein S6